MKIIEPNVTEVTDFEGVDNFYKAVARAARICYASDNRITKLHKEGTYKCTDNWYSQEKIIAVKGKSYEVKKVNNDFVLIGENGHNAHNFNTQCFDSWFFKYFENPDDKALVERLIESKHFSPFEHAIIYVPCKNINELGRNNNNSIEYQVLNNTRNCIKYIVDEYNDKLQHYELAINGRILIETALDHSDYPMETLDGTLQIMKQFELDKHWFKSFIVDTSIGCTREMNRHHNNFYICEQSTRYCNFSKDKFDGEVSFNKPYWYDTASIKKQNAWEFAMRQAEFNYLDNQKDFTIDEIRGVLPLDTHTRVIYTSTVEEWNHIINLRLKGTAGKPHGDIMIIAEKINNIINNEKKI